jgi:hypothetical protein
MEKDQIEPEEEDSEQSPWRKSLEQLMGKPRVYADMHKTDGSRRLVLVCRGTHEDLQHYKITLQEGLALDFWTDDADDAGNADPLLFEGVVHYDHAKEHWVAAIDWNNIRNASEDKRRSGGVLREA